MSNIINSSTSVAIGRATRGATDGAALPSGELHLRPASPLDGSRPTSERVDLLGVEVDCLAVDELNALLVERIRNKERSLITYVNAHCLNVSYRNARLRDFLNRASIVYCDGIGVLLGSRILGYRLAQRIPLTEWIWQLAGLAEGHGFTLFFLGARPGVVGKATGRLEERFPNLRVVGTHHGYFDRRFDSRENEEVIRRINTVEPDILIVGLGVPAQEHWLLENWDRIEATVGFTGGGVFDYVSGELCRGPQWMTDNGLEWLSRLIIEPKRLWRRYLLGNPLFLLRVLRQRRQRRARRKRANSRVAGWLSTLR